MPALLNYAYTKIMLAQSTKTYTRKPRKIVLVHSTLADVMRSSTVLRYSPVRYHPTSPELVADLSEFTAH